MKKHFYILACILLSLTCQAQIITTVAGFSGDGVLATSTPSVVYTGVAIDRLGNIYFADQRYGKIRKVNVSTGIITTVAGNGTYGYGGDGVIATSTSLSSPSDVAVDSLGNLYIADLNNNRIRKVNASTGIITTVAGNGTSGYGGDGSAATAAYISYPRGITVDKFGNLYIVDQYSHKIRKVNASTGIITTIAGNGSYGYGGDGNLATSATIAYATGITFDSIGNLYFADAGNKRIRKINAITGIISTVAGNGIQGFGGDGSSATLANLNNPIDVKIDSSGNLFIADANNNRIRKVNASTGIITTIAGNGTAGYGGDGGAASAAILKKPSGLNFDISGNLYITDGDNYRIRKINGGSGVISTVAGNGTQGYSGDGIAANATTLNYPRGLTLDNFGNLYIADASNHRIRKVNAITGIITTIAGNGTSGFSGDGGLATNATLNTPYGIALDSIGNIYIAEYLNHRVRKVNASTGIITTIAGNGVQGNGGDGGAATAANLNVPSSIDFDSSGNLYISVLNSNKIRKVNAITGIISTVAGIGGNGIYGGDSAAATAANLNSPSGVASDGSGNLFIADQFNHRIRKVNASTGIISTIAGNGTFGYGGDSASATSANLFYPTDVTIDGLGNLYIADRNNNRIRKVNASTGIISTVVGNGTIVYNGDSIIATTASLSGPVGVAVDKVGNLFIADAGNYRIRKVFFGIYNNSITSNQTICLGSNLDSLIGSVPLGGNGTYNYTWLKSTTSANSGFLPITASNTKNYKPLSLIQNTWFRRLVVSDSYKDTSTSILVTVYPKPIIGFTINNSSQCINGNNFLFVDTSSISSGNITRKWNLGLGNNDTSLLANPIKTYSTANSFAVKLIGTSNNGCKDSVTKTVIVNQKPTVGFTINNLAQCLNNNNFIFADTSSITSGTITRKWNFGAGNNDTLSLINPNKVYSTENTYSVKLLVTSNNGCKDSISKTVTVYPKPIVNFTLPSVICLKSAIASFALVNTSSINSGTMSHNWLFSDNTTSNLLNPTKTVSDTGNLVVKLISTSNNGCTDSVSKTVHVHKTPTANYTVNDSTQCVNGNSFLFTNQSNAYGQPVQYNWNFGVGNNVISNTATQTYNYSTVGNYTVRLIAASTSYNCADTFLATTAIYPKPTVNFTSPAYLCFKNTSISFALVNTSTINSGTMSHNWLFSDTTTSNLLNPTKTVTDTGNLVVKLISTSNNGCTDSVSKTVNIRKAPKAFFLTYDTAQCITNNYFEFWNQSEDNGLSNQYTWHFGVGNNVISNNLFRFFSYNFSGTYTVKLIALSSNNCADSFNQIVNVVDKATVVNFAINKTAQCLSNNNFVFTNQSTPNNSSLKYKWYFGNGDTSTLLSPNYHYNTLGGTSVKLVVTANNECLDSITKNISVNAEAVANFTINNAAQCLTGNSFGFTNSATNSNTQTWSFGDASNSTVLNPTKTYSNAGSFAVKLVAKNNANCNDSITKTVTVYPSANLSFGINNASQCLKNNVFNFTNTSSISSGSATYKWVLGEADTTTNTSKTFTQIGNYKIYLLSLTNQNCADTFSKDIVVKASPIIGTITGNVAPNSISTPFAYSVLSQANSTYNWTTTGTIQSGQGTNAVNIIWPSIGTGNLKAQITNANNCTDSTNLLVNITSVGVNNLRLENDLKVYPNPTKTSITITNKTNLAGKKYNITNIVGQIVISGKLNLDETIVNLETLQSGVYLLSIDGLNKQSIKVIKE